MACKDVCVEWLRYEFTEDEILEKGKELARKNTEMSEAQASKKAIVAQLKEKEERATSEIATLSRQVSNGYEYRNIDCKIRFDLPSVGTCTIFRTDTGEIVKERAMTAEESQGMLAFEGKPIQ